MFVPDLSKSSSDTIPPLANGGSLSRVSHALEFMGEKSSKLGPPYRALDIGRQVSIDISIRGANSDLTKGGNYAMFPRPLVRETRPTRFALTAQITKAAEQDARNDEEACDDQNSHDDQDVQSTMLKNPLAPQQVISPAPSPPRTGRLTPAARLFQHANAANSVSPCLKCPCGTMLRPNGCTSHQCRRRAWRSRGCCRAL